MSERLAIDSSINYEAKWVGKKGDDDFSYNAKKISRIEFNKSVSAIPLAELGDVSLPLIAKTKASIPGSGHGDAKVAETTSSNVRVHYWLDPGTKLTYSLKVWVID
ncbi:hypothetical protein PN466_19440 [Roseofilum reptotaenium CS-1145]|uniref:Uncharacterized protein n=1 Tax=Roseofilum reptotaenium AO1-A TaxID=1925591 RepID=A0A1L9QTC8_9CYAN|nr:hypothetical protein [Roseofilum reptotaenium]MDB9519123.1 hypothetical protein [Roseofilum reptotaenium CS-1145]OJJ25876.1 hypothetical protein BI308_09060 [Roseofilum reptotaenium AO1-A]